MFRARTERRPRRAPQGFEPPYAVVQPESPSPYCRWAVSGARGRACACIPPITDEEIREALGESVTRIIETIRTCLEQTLPELAADIVDKRSGACAAAGRLAEDSPRGGRGVSLKLWHVRRESSFHVSPKSGSVTKGQAGAGDAPWILCDKSLPQTATPTGPRRPRRRARLANVQPAMRYVSGAPPSETKNASQRPSYLRSLRCAACLSVLGVISGVIGGSVVLSFLIPGVGPSRSSRWPRARRSPPRRTETSCEANTRGSDDSLRRKVRARHRPLLSPGFF